MVILSMLYLVLKTFYLPPVMLGPLVWFCFSENMTKINRSL